MAASSTARRRKIAAVICLREEFIATVSRVLKDLMETHGYSRERATEAILQHLQEEDDWGKEFSEAETLSLMKQRRIAHQQAIRALLIARSIKRAMAIENISEEDAVRKLINKISHANLTPKEEKQSTKNDSIVPQDVKKSDFSLPTLQMKQSTPRAAIPSTKKQKIAAKYTKSRPGKIVRKRLMEEPTTNQLTSAENHVGGKRPRADSTAEAVSAKLAESVPSKNEEKKVGVAVRVKRTRSVDDADFSGVVATASKRCRTASSTASP